MSSKASSLDSSAASRLFSISSCTDCFFKCSDSHFSLSVSCSMSETGRQFNNSFGEDFVYASKRRQGGKVETYSDLVMGRESAEAGEVVIAVARGERNQEQQSASGKG